MVLPIIVGAFGAEADLTALVLWPLVLLYGGALIPAPAGGGAMEFGFGEALLTVGALLALGLTGFGAIMNDVLPPEILAASLIWWRFYSYYAYVLLGAFAAGRTVMRALGRT